MYDFRRKIRIVDPVRPRSSRSRQQRTENGKSVRKKKTVLIVDDEQLIADTMVEILKRSGFNAFCAYSPRAALDIALQVNPDIVVTDVVMPQMNGVQLAIAIREALPSAEIILLSGQAGITDIVERGRKDGYIFEVVAKPVHPENLLERLHKI